MRVWISISTNISKLWRLHVQYWIINRNICSQWHKHAEKWQVVKTGNRIQYKEVNDNKLVHLSDSGRVLDCGSQSWFQYFWMAPALMLCEHVFLLFFCFEILFCRYNLCTNSSVKVIYLHDFCGECNVSESFSSDKNQQMSTPAHSLVVQIQNTLQFWGDSINRTKEWYRCRRY